MSGLPKEAFGRSTQESAEALKNALIRLQSIEDPFKKIKKALNKMVSNHKIIQITYDDIYWELLLTAIMDEVDLYLDIRSRSLDKKIRTISFNLDQKFYELERKYCT